jgi:predicted nucleic acid-binding protein
MPNGKMSCFVDTTLLVYVADPSEPQKRPLVRDLLAEIIRNHTLVLSPQSLNECYRVVTERRNILPRRDAQRFVGAWQPYSTAPYDFDVTMRAWKIQDRHRFGWWDSMLLASASFARCDIFLSEDMQHEREVENLMILNPFKLNPNVQFAR